MKDTKDTKEAYVAEAKERLGREINAKLAEIRKLVGDEIAGMKASGGADAAESILCAVDITTDQVKDALGGWAAPEGGEA